MVIVRALLKHLRTVCLVNIARLVVWEHSYTFPVVWWVSQFCVTLNKMPEAVNL